MNLNRLKRPGYCAVILILLLCSACNRKGQQQDAPGGPGGQAMPVKTQAVHEQPVPDFTEYIATLRSRGSAILQPEVEGQVVKIFVHSGQRVKPGDPLLLIDPRRQEANLSSMEATIRTKQATL